MFRFKTCLQAALLASVALPAAAAGVAPDHIVVLIEENQLNSAILGSSNAPYFNMLASTGLLYTNAHGSDHDSQPNYLELFAGANPGNQSVSQAANGGVLTQHYNPSINIETPTDPAVISALNNSDNRNNTPFTTPNLYTSLTAVGKTFTGYSEDLPSVGFNGDSAPGSQGLRSYVRKHNPWAQWSNVPTSVNQSLTPFSAMAAANDFSGLSTVSMVVPGEAHDMHDTVSKDGLYAVGGAAPYGNGVDIHGNPVNPDTTIQGGDNWAKQNIDAYRQWAVTHNSLLITVWDENNYTTGANNVALIVNGAPSLLQTGQNNNYVNHFDILNYLESVYGGAPSGLAATASGLALTPSGQLAVPEPATFGVFGIGLLGLIAIRRRRA